MSFPVYESYKDSGVEWLGQVPSHWEAMRLKWQLARNDGGAWGDDPDGEDDTVVLRSTEQTVNGRWQIDDPAVRKLSAAEKADTLLKFGDLVVTKSSGSALHIGKTTIVNQEIASLGCCYSNFMQRLRVKSSFLPVLAWHIMNSNLAREQFGYLSSSTTGLANLNGSTIASAWVVVPPPAEQRAIAAFLDRETAKIDALVEAQWRLIELLKEKRGAVISHAVTKGIDPSAPMKDSGVEWLGQVPAHWEVSQSRRMFGVRSEQALPDDQMLTASQKYGVLFQADFVEREGRRVVEVIMGKDSLRHVEPNDFIISMRSFQGGLEWSRLRGSTSFHYVMVTPVKWVHPQFFAHLFKSSSYIQALRATTDLIRDGQEIRYSHFVKVPLPVVPLEEQKRIAEFLGAEVGRYDALLGEAEGHIALLNERRAALISAAVTGKIDTRDLMQTAEAA